MNKIVNSRETLIQEMIDGYLGMNDQELSLVNGAKLCVRKKNMEDKVQIVVAGGSGNEPWPIGFVGEGLADAVACGHVYAAPSAINIMNMCREIPHEQGILILGTNHMGDLLNFNLVCELLTLEGIRAKCIFINDDIGSDLDNYEERRGIAGVALAVKMAGYFSAEGFSLDEIYELMLEFIPSIRTLGVTTSPGYLPPDGKQMFPFEEKHIVFGMGFNGEPGIEVSPLLSSKEIVHKIMSYICCDLTMNKNDEYYVLLNGFGFTSHLEMLIVSKDIQEYFKENRFNLKKMKYLNVLCPQGTGGFSISVVKLNELIYQSLISSSSSPMIQF